MISPSIPLAIMWANPKQAKAIFMGCRVMRSTPCADMEAGCIPAGLGFATDNTSNINAASINR